MLTNQVTKKDDPYDKDGMYEAARVALESALECEKYDQRTMPRVRLNQSSTRLTRIV